MACINIIRQITYVLTTKGEVLYGSVDPIHYNIALWLYMSISSSKEKYQYNSKGLSPFSLTSMDIYTGCHFA